MSTTLEQIEAQIKAHPVLLYMKGNASMPQCGFSNRAVQILEACGASFETVDVLANPDIRAELPKYANWPTFPQLYINGELVGGSDIMFEMYETGELQTMLKTVV